MIAPARRAAFRLLLAASLAPAAARPDERTPATPVPSAGSPAATRPAAPRDPRWAAPLERPGLRNLHRVSETLYRGAQPTDEGFAELRRLGVKTIVNLRGFHGERERVAAAGLGYERISFQIWHPEDSDMRRFLQIATDPARQPVFVHCKRGADRTGTAAAVYRICVEGWTPEEAIDEMANGGFAFERRFGHLKAYLRGLDLQACRGAWIRQGPDAGAR